MGRFKSFDEFQKSKTQLGLLVALFFFVGITISFHISGIDWTKIKP